MPTGKFLVALLVCSLVAGSSNGAGAAQDRPDVPPEPRLSLLAGFSDTAGHLFEADIDWLSATGVTRGCNPPDNTRFCPEDSVTRGQMAAFLARGLSLPTGVASFSDTVGNVFEADIGALASAGITRGCNPPDNTRFCPDEVVTRGQMAAFLVRALGLDAGANAFTDDNDHVFEADIAALAAAGITRGCNPPDNTRFCPDDPVTRGQMAAFLHRALENLFPPEEPPESGEGSGGPIDQELDADTGKPADATGFVGEDNAGDVSGWQFVDDGEPGGEAATLPSGAGSLDLAGETPPPPPSGDIVEVFPMPVFGEPDGGSSGELDTQRFVNQPQFAYNAGWQSYSSLPYAVGQLTFQQAGGRISSCTGTLVSRNLVLTAAHCIYDDAGRANAAYWFQPDENHNGWAEKLWWYAPATAARVPSLYNQAVQQLGSSKGFLNAQVLDYALVAFNPGSDGRYPGDVYTPFGMTYMTPAANPPAGDYSIYEWDVTRWATGYPIEGWFGTQGNTASDAWPWICNSNDGGWYNWGGTGHYMVTMGCVFNGGMSGGPVFSNVGGQARVFGVVSSMGRYEPCSSGCTRWYGNNLWAAPLLNTNGAHGFDDFWSAVRADPISR